MNGHQAIRPLHPAVAVPQSVRDLTTAMSDHDDRGVEPADRFRRGRGRPAVSGRPRRSGLWQGMLYLLAILTAMVTGSAFVLGGLLAGAAGFTAILLAAAMPLAAIAWAITLSSLEHGPRGWPETDPGDGQGETDG